MLSLKIPIFPEILSQNIGTTERIVLCNFQINVFHVITAFTFEVMTPRIELPKMAKNITDLFTCFKLGISLVFYEIYL